MINLVKRVPYWQLIAIPLLLFFAGVTSNQLVLIANHDRFPVMVNSAKLAKFVEDKNDADEKAAAGKHPDKHGIVYNSKISSDTVKAAGRRDLGPDGMIDDVHCVMVPSSHLKALSDIFDLGSIYSVGDFLLMLSEWLGSFTPIMWLALVLRKLMA
jgi:hypothetical protein